MATVADVVQLSSKGQVVIPARLRRELGLETGQSLRVRRSPAGGIVLTPVGLDDQEMAASLRRFRDWVRRSGRDLVEELHTRRRRERAVEVRRREHGRP